MTTYPDRIDPRRAAPDAAAAGAPAPADPRAFPAPDDGLSVVARHKALDRIWTSGKGWKRLSAVNHTTIGIRTMLTAVVFFAVGGVLAMLIRAQLATPHSQFLDAPAYAQVFTMHGTIMMFLFAIPLLEGFAMYLLPKILGARDLAFPRMTAYGYWCYLFGGTTLMVAMLLGLAPDSGWFMYTPLSSDVYSPGINSDLWLLGITFVEISAMSIGIELTVSILRMRAPGMSLGRMPIFGWYMLVTALMIVVGFPPLILGSLLLEAERAFGLPFFDPTRGGDPLLWQHLFWIFGHPEVYIIFLPAAGMLATLIPTFARRPLVAYKAVVAAIIAMGVISFLIWAHHMFTVGMSKMAVDFFAVASGLVAIPTAVQIFAWIATMARGRPQMTVPMLYVFGFLFIFVNGGLTGVMLAVAPFNWQVHDTAFVTAHLHYVLFGSLIFGSLAGLYYWLPQVTGRLSVHSLSVPAFWLIFLGFNGTFLLMHLTGLLGMPRRVFDYTPDDGWTALNLLSSVSGFVQAMGFGLIVLDVIVTRKLGPAFARNPWAARTLEWAMPTPPPSYAFAALPHIDRRADQIDPDSLAPALAAGHGYLATPRNGWLETLAVDPVSGRPDHIVILPQPTYLPLVQGLVTWALIVALLAKAYWIAAGAGLVLAGLFILAGQKAGLDRDHGPMAAGGGLDLPLHTEVRGSMPAWGMILTLVADAVVYASLAFGALYLRLSGASWPDQAGAFRGEAMPQAALLVAGSLAVAALVSRWTVRQNQRPSQNGAGRAVPLALTGLATTVAMGAALWMLASGHLPDPRAHPLGAILAGLAAYALVHAFVGVLFVLSNALRISAGRVTARRAVDLDLTRMWLDYAAVTTIVSCLLALMLL